MKSLMTVAILINLISANVFANNYEKAYLSYSCDVQAAITVDGVVDAVSLKGMLVNHGENYYFDKTGQVAPPENNETWSLNLGSYKGGDDLQLTLKGPNDNTACDTLMYSTLDEFSCATKDGLMVVCEQNPLVLAQ